MQLHPFFALHDFGWNWMGNGLNILCIDREFARIVVLLHTAADSTPLAFFNAGQHRHFDCTIAEFLGHKTGASIGYFEKLVLPFRAVFPVFDIQHIALHGL